MAKEMEEPGLSLNAGQERETALHEVLCTLNLSRGDESAVFDAILDKSLQLCTAHFGAVLLDNEADTTQKAIAYCGSSARWGDNQIPLDPALSMIANASLLKTVVQTADLAATEWYRQGQRN